MFSSLKTWLVGPTTQKIESFELVIIFVISQGSRHEIVLGFPVDGFDIKTPEESRERAEAQQRYVLDWFANIMDKNPRTPAVFRTKTVVLAGEDIVFMGAHVVNRKL